MALIMEVMQTIANPVGKLALWLEETYQVDMTETIAKWHELTGMNITVSATDVITDVVQSLDIPHSTTTTPKKAKRSAVRDKETCMYIYQRTDKAGERCATVPKGESLYCSAHRPKNSAKATKVSKVAKTTKVKKQAEGVPKTDIDPDFASDNEVAEAAVVTALVEEQVIKTTEVKPKRKKLIPVPTSNEEDSDEDEEVVPKPKKSPKKAKKVIKKKTVSDNNDDSEPDVPNKPLLKKKGASKAVIPPSKQYDTDKEQIDQDLDLED